MACPFRSTLFFDPFRSGFGFVVSERRALRLPPSCGRLSRHLRCPFDRFSFDGTLHNANRFYGSLLFSIDRSGSPAIVTLNSYRERRRELALRNRGNRGKAESRSRQVLTPAPERYGEG